ncbi:MAG: potassium transporter Kup [Gammaproteobacteria bacterium]|nr:potassium transporter Kup [Gammaproteobacteria bacterium]
MSQATSSTIQKQAMPVLIISAIGVVFGDIGTSPLYALREAFYGKHAAAATPDNVLGILSLMIWALTLVVSIKYVLFVMRADNHGEGGIMAMIALIPRAFGEHSRRRYLLIIMGLFGAALFYGDSMLTPAISVLSAVEGLEIAAPGLDHFVVPLAMAILVGLFLIQSVGTGNIGKLFGPVMLVWFTVLGVLGVISIMQTPQVLMAINPFYAFHYFQLHGWMGLTILGAVVLAVTGAEALYADMGHFGKRPIQTAWLTLVFPGLALNYFGQGALILRDPTAVVNPFYLLVPEWALFPMILLATLATVIASQAVITGAFSVTRQAVQLGYLPRIQMRHTSDSEIGQIYIPFINYILFIGVMLLVLGFQSSSNLAAAYGIAVTGTMAIDTILAFTVMWAIMKWKLPVAMACMVFFLIIDFAFLAANAPKIIHGGWFPLAMGLIVFTLLTTWKRGRKLLLQRMIHDNIDLDTFIEGILAFAHTRVPGTAVFLHATGKGVPHALLHNLSHNKVVHERVVLLTVITADVPAIDANERARITDLGGGFYRMQLRYGFREEPNIPEALAQCSAQGMDFNMMATSFFLSRETLIVTKMRGMGLWREKLFVWMAQNAESAMTFFKLPVNRVLELGTQIEI